MHNRTGKSKKNHGFIGFTIGVCLVMAVGFHTLGIDLIFQIESVAIYSILALVIGAIGYGVAAGMNESIDLEFEETRNGVKQIKSLPGYNDGTADGHAHKLLTK